MKRTLKNAAILLVSFILATWIFNQFFRPLLQESIDSTLVWMVTVALPFAGGMVAILKGTLELTAIISGKTADKTLNLTNVQQKRYREDILLQVERYWIKGYLEKALAEGVLLQPGIAYRPDLVSDPWLQE